MRRICPKKSPQSTTSANSDQHTSNKRSSENSDSLSSAMIPNPSPSNGPNQGLFPRSLLYGVSTMAILLFLQGGVGLESSVLAHEGHDQAFSEPTRSATDLPKLTITPDGQKAIGIQTYHIQPTALRQVLSVTGQVQAAENQTAKVTPQVAGVITQVKVQQGDTVKTGQTLALLNSLEAANLLRQLLEDRARLRSEIAQSRLQLESDITVQAKEVELSQATMQREQGLLAEGIAARKDYLVAKNTSESAQARLRALQRRLTQEVSLRQQQLSITTSAGKSQLRVMGLPASTVDQALAKNQVISIIPITASMAGVITAREVSAGESVTPGQSLFSVVNLSPVWVVVNVFQNQVSRLQLGQSVQIQHPDGTRGTGSIATIGTVIDPTQRTLPVRIVCQNSAHRLKPGMFVTANITTGASQGNRVLIPASAVVESGNRQWVYVKQANDFIPVVVQAERTATSSQVEIRDGLYEGDDVVIAGANQLRAQSLLASSSATHTHEANQPNASKSSQNANPNSLDGLLPGFLLGMLVMGALGALWFFLKKRRR